MSGQYLSDTVMSMWMSRRRWSSGVGRHFGRGSDSEITFRDYRRSLVAPLPGSSLRECCPAVCRIGRVGCWTLLGGGVFGVLGWGCFSRSGISVLMFRQILAESRSGWGVGGVQEGFRFYRTRAFAQSILWYRRHRYLFSKGRNLVEFLRATS